MNLYGTEDLKESEGDMMLIYGDSGVGKSVSLIQTCPDPILYIMAEGRDVTKMLKAAERPKVKIKFGFYENWDDFINFFNDSKNFTPYKSIVIDSLSHLMSVCLSDEILEESYDSMDKKKIDKELAMRVKMSMEGYGTLSGQMLRFMSMATKLTQEGKVVCCIARTEQNPKFNRALQGAPALKGQEFSKHMPGFFDFIGYVEPRVADGSIVYPPKVSFSSDGSFMAKWTGLSPASGVNDKPLNVQKILEIAHGKSKKGGVNGKERTIGENSDV